MGLVFQRVQAEGQEALDPVANRIFLRPEEGGDFGNAPAGSCQPEVFQAIPGAPLQFRSAGTLGQYVSLRRGELDSMQRE